MEILTEYEAEKLSLRQGYILFAIIAALKDKSGELLKANFKDEDLLFAFNLYLKKNYKQIKRNSKGFENIKTEVKSRLSNL